MKTLIIMAHPNIAQSQFNRAWQTELKQHDRLIFQFPLYWYSTPPLLKQW